jgi:hypothetical protein
MVRSGRLATFVSFVALAAALASSGEAQTAGEIQSSPSRQRAASPNSDPSLLEAAPGIPLPPYGTAWILDTAENKSRLIRMHSSSPLPNKHVAKNLARAEVMVLKDVSTLDLPGGAAALRITNRSTVIFVRKPELQTPEVQSIVNAMGAASHYVLLRMRALEGRRVLCSFSYWKLGGKRTRHEDDVETTSEEIPGGRWLKLAPKQPLPDGEYAVVAMPEDTTQAGTYVYDFGVGPLLKPAANP